MAKPDWEAIRAAYQNGESVRGIARKHGISHTAINVKAKSEGWKKVSAIVSKEVSTQRKVSSGNSKKTEAPQASGSDELDSDPQHNEQEKQGLLKPQYEQFAQNVAQRAGT